MLYEVRYRIHHERLGGHNPKHTDHKLYVQIETTQGWEYVLSCVGRLIDGESEYDAELLSIKRTNTRLVTI
jgi:hypothetical protein